MQEITQSVVDIMGSQGLYCVSYIDDLAGANKDKKDADKSFNKCGEILKQLGLVEASNKVNEPSQRMVWLGVHFNSDDMSMSIPKTKIEEIHELVKTWRDKEWCTQTQLKSLLGKLFFAANCSGPLRLFCNRLLATLRTHTGAQCVILDKEFQKDIEWIEEFLITFNGVGMIDKLPTSSTELVVDSCMSGGGDIMDKNGL